jgi:glycosyltransferase involved in cell wall biosynthesis
MTLPDLSILSMTGTKASYGQVSSSSHLYTVGFGGAFQDLGVEVDYVSPPPALNRLISVAQHRQAESKLAHSAVSALNRVRGELVARQMRSASLVVAAYASEIECRLKVPFVTFDDQTVGQGARLGYFPGISQRRLESWIARQRTWYTGAKVCFAQTETHAACIRDEYGIPAERITIVGQRVGLELPEGLGSGRDWRTPRFLFIGMDWERKNGPRLLDAFRDVRRIHPSAELNLVGAHPEVREDGVITHGRLDIKSEDGAARMTALFESATCLVVPSLAEAAGGVYAEAASAGIPAIGSTNGGSGDVIASGGVVVDPFDQQAITDAMLSFCDPKTAELIGELARGGNSRTTNKRAAQTMLEAIERVFATES